MRATPVARWAASIALAGLIGVAAWPRDDDRFGPWRIGRWRRVPVAAPVALRPEQTSPEGWPLWTVSPTATLEQPVDSAALAPPPAW